MVHNMSLQPKPFGQIAGGEKTIELRLYDEKRQQIQVGDTIVFSCAEENGLQLTAEVIGLHVFDSFETLYSNLPLEKCGYAQEEMDAASPKDMEVYYPKERQVLYGVVGIELLAT